MAKKNKIKLTPAERKALKAEKKRLKKLAIEEAKRQVKRDHLSRELEFGRRNRRKLEKIWRQTLIDIKEPVLRTEYQLGVNNLERLIDAKDFTISLLQDELDEAEEQYRMNIRAHCERIDDIIAIFHDRLDDLKNKYDDELNNLMQSTDDEMEDLKNRQKDDEDYLNVMIFGLDTIEKNMEKTVRSEYLSKLNEETNKNSDELQQMRGSKENIFENLWNNYKYTLKDYINSTVDRRKEYDILNKQDAFMRNKIKEQYVQIYDSYESIKRFKERQLADKEKIMVHLNDLDLELKFFSDHFNDLKDTNTYNIEFDNQQLTLLVNVSNKAIEFLKTLCDKAEKILRFNSICRKYETQKEKVLPFPKSEPDIETPIKHQVQHVTLYKELEPFWQKYGNIHASHYILQEEFVLQKEINMFAKQNIEEVCNYSIVGCLAMKPTFTV